jgi:RNA polymerase sigma-70 factor (ECF subfamily)
MTIDDSSPLLAGLLADGAWLTRLARGLAGADADDVVQETWMRALRRRPDRNRALRPWLAEVARNFARDRARSRSRREEREQAVVYMGEGQTASPEEILSRLDLQRMIAELVAALDAPLRETVFLLYCEGRTAAEIARLKSIPEGTVRWRHKTALERLRRGLDERHGGDRDSWLRVFVPLLGVPRSPSGQPEDGVSGAVTPGFTFGARRGVLAGGLAGLACVAGVFAVLVTRDGEDDRRGSITGDRLKERTSGPPGASGGRPAPGSQEPGGPRVAAALVNETLSACQDELKKLHQRLEVTQFMLDGRNLEAAYLRGQPNPTAERALNPVLEQALQAVGQQIPARRELSCRGQLCRLSLSFTKTTRPDPGRLRQHAPLAARLKNQPYRLGFRGNSREGIEAWLDVYLPLRNPAGEPGPELIVPETTTLEACAQARSTVQAKLDEVARQMDASRAPRDQYDNGPPNPALTNEATALVRRALAGVSPLPTVECRAQTCRVLPTAGGLEDSQLRQRLDEDRDLSARVSRTACCDRGLYYTFKSNGAAPPEVERATTASGASAIPLLLRRTLPTDLDGRTGDDLTLATAMLAVSNLSDGDLEKAERHAKQALAAAPKAKTGGAAFTEALALHHAHLVLGAVALRGRDEVASAVQHLLASVDRAAEAQVDLNPNMQLARELLDRGEQAAVLRYLDRCGSVWRFGRDSKIIETWKADIAAGRAPRFSSHLSTGGWAPSP